MRVEGDLKGSRSQFYYDVSVPRIAGNPNPFLMGFDIIRHYLLSLHDTSIVGDECIEYQELDKPKRLTSWYYKHKMKPYVFCNGKTSGTRVDELLLMDGEDKDFLVSELIRKGVLIEYHKGGNE